MPVMTCALTVAIPTYNGADRLPMVLAALLAQINTEAIDWEIWVIDNNSRDRTLEVLRDFQQRSPLIHWDCEPEQGAAFGRQRAIERAQGQWVAFLDDDTVPAADWVAQVWAFAQSAWVDRALVGAFGGRILPELAGPEPVGFGRIRSLFAIVDRGDRPFVYDPHPGLLPPSAGLVVRRSAWLACVPRRLILGGRTGDTWLTSEDLEALVYLQRSGYAIAYCPTMQLIHQIPAQRLTADYLRPFARGIGWSRYVVRMLRVDRPRRPIATGFYFLSDLRRCWQWALAHPGGWRSPDPVLVCERSLLISTLTSPGVMGRWLHDREATLARSPAPLLAADSIAIAIPTYNGAARLPALFDRLRDLEIPEGLTWEIWAIDNNSRDRTWEVLIQIQQTWTACPLHISQEPRQGAAFARQRAMRLSGARWVALLDDDNWPEPAWLREAIAFAQAHPELGAFGGKILGAYAVEPPPALHELAGYLAIRDYPEFADRPGQFDAHQLRLPPAAALVVNRAAWLAAVPPEPHLGGKRAGRFVQGDDYEPLLYLARSGYGIGFAPRLRTHHQIPAWRLDRAYLCQLARACGLATFALKRIVTPPIAWPLLALRIMVANGSKALRLLPTNPTQDDWVRSVRRSFFWGCALSPWEDLRRTWRR
ncbi:MAG: glycosyltransferase [Oscillatoriales cyanobacterium]|nr:MAG: glycosyltransferase [Oscillatoriales cyanobacterium]